MEGKSEYNISLSLEEFGIIDTSLDTLEAKLSREYNRQNTPVSKKESISAYLDRISGLHKKISRLLSY